MDGAIPAIFTRPACGTPVALCRAVPGHSAGIAPALCAVLTACAVTATGGSLLGAGDSVECERSHIRATDSRAEGAIAYGIERSPTFRSLVDAISHSDLIVYVTAQFDMVFPLDGEIHFVTSVGSHRYMRVLVRGQLSTWDRSAMIAHELQHAREVADAPSVRDNLTMDALYHQIGFGVGVDRHETEAARAVAIQVTEELSPGWTPATAR